MWRTTSQNNSCSGSRQGDSNIAQTQYMMTVACQKHLNGWKVISSLENKSMCRIQPPWHYSVFGGLKKERRKTPGKTQLHHVGNLHNEHSWCGVEWDPKQRPGEPECAHPHCGTPRFDRRNYCQQPPASHTKSCE